MTYEYLCSACAHEWEVDQRISDPPLDRCPKCGGKSAKRMVSGGGGFILKGGGWYADGYASKAGVNGVSKSDTSPTSETSAKTGASAASVTKPEAASTKTDTATKSAAA